MRSFFQILLLSSALTLTGCSDNTQIFSSTSSGSAKQSSASSAGYYKVGNPYQVAGVWYYPKEDYTYKEIGVSSWYGPDFHNGITANGELYDMHALTAAHRTLPLPSVVRVTNLQNGRSLVLRVNDRGPFVNNRVIDVSMRAAQMLGFKEQGTTQVQVEILPEESKKLKEELLAAAEGVGAPVPLNNDAEYRREQPEKPRNLDYSPNRPRLANPPPSVEGAPLVAASAQKADSPYNDWDEDMPKAQAQRTSYEDTAAKPKASPKPQPKPQPKPAQAKKPVSFAAKTAVAPGYYVQVGAFGNEENAKKMKEKISRFGSAIILPMTTNGKTLYRVRLGPADAKKALEMMDKLSNNGISDARLVEEKGNMTAGKRLDNAF